jgi:hypothetical protein
MKLLLQLAVFLLAVLRSLVNIWYCGCIHFVEILACLLDRLLSITFMGGPQ